MSVLSGKYGAVGGVFDTIKRWSLTELVSGVEFRTSNTKSGTGRREGVYDYNGIIEGYAGVPPVMPSEYFDFEGYTAPTTGARGAAGQKHSAVNAICEEVTITWNWGTCELLSWALRFAAGEPLTITHASGVLVDAVVPDPAIVCGTKVTLTSNSTVWDNIVSASLTIRANNPTFVNSTTQCFTGRRPGIIDWNASVVEQTTTPNAILTPAPCLGTIVGGSTILRLWVDATTYWDLTWAQLIDITDLETNMDTGDIIQATNNFAMNGFLDGVIGKIARPGEDGTSNPYWWPTEVIADTLPF